MANQNIKLEADLFEELSDADLMAIIGGTLTTKLIGEVFPVLDFADKSTNFDEAGNGITSIGKGVGDAVGHVGGLVTSD